MRIGLPLTYNTAPLTTGFYRQLHDRLKAIPGVNDVTLASMLPISGGDPNGDISIGGRPSTAGELGAASFRRVMPNYFELLGIPLVRGRWFDDRDDGSRGRPVVINANFARHFWPTSDPIGQTIRIGPQDSNAWLTIVGVVGDVRQAGPEVTSPFSVYERWLPLPPGVSKSLSGPPAIPRTCSLRFARNSARRARAAGGEIANYDRTNRLNIAPRRLNLLLFGLLRLPRAPALRGRPLWRGGLCGSAAHSGVRHPHGIGCAQPGDVLRLVLGEGLKLVLAGVTIGLVATLSLAHLMTGLLFGVAPTDPATLAAVAVLIAVVALSALAGRRAALHGSDQSMLCVASDAFYFLPAGAASCSTVTSEKITVSEASAVWEQTISPTNTGFPNWICVCPNSFNSAPFLPIQTVIAEPCRTSFN